MLVLTLRTDKPVAELGLYQGGKCVAADTWAAHLQLAETIHRHLEDLLQAHHYQLKDLQGLVAYCGPGSFTGLRIGLSVTNALAYALTIPVYGSTGNDWQAEGLRRLQAGDNEEQVLPEYGAPVHITQPKK